MAHVRARTFEFEVTLGADGVAHSDRGTEPLAVDTKTWTPEHLVLSALCHCSLTSLRHHAARRGVGVDGQARARGTVTRRPEDGRFAFVEIELAAEIAIERAEDEGAEDERAVRELLELAERDCFVGASLTAKPRYRWTVNGKEIM